MRNAEILKYFGADAVKFNNSIKCTDIIPALGHTIYTKDGIDVFNAKCIRDCDCSKHIGNGLTIPTNGAYAKCSVCRTYMSPIELTAVSLGAVSCSSCKSRNFSEIEIQNVMRIIERKTEIKQYFDRMNKTEA